MVTNLYWKPSVKSVRKFLFRDVWCIFRGCAKCGFRLIQSLQRVLSCLKLSARFILLIVKLKSNIGSKNFWIGLKSITNFWMKNHTAKKPKDIGAFIKWREDVFVYQKGFANMFTFLQNPNISKTTNGIESFFGHLKSNLNIHWGLTKSRRKKFIEWYLFYKNLKS